MAKRYQKLTATGSANTTVLDTGIESTQAEEKRVTAVLIYVTGHIANDVEIWIEQERIARIPDYFFITEEATASTNVQKANNRMYRIELDHVLPVGQRMQAGINCGATAKNISGAYEYELT
jgi:hypothetical protein